MANSSTKGSWHASFLYETSRRRMASLCIVIFAEFAIALKHELEFRGVLAWCVTLSSILAMMLAGQLWRGGWPFRNMLWTD